MSVPANLQRFADFMAAHSSPEGWEDSLYG